MTTATNLPDLTMRNGSLQDLVALLKQQSDVKYDVVVSADHLRYDHGLLRIVDGAARIDDEGVTSCDALLAPTDIFENGLAGRLDIPRHYLRKMREEAMSSDVERHETIADLLDHNVNTWMSDVPSRRFLVRGFRVDDPQQVGIARAILSDRFAMYDNLDVLMATLAGINESGARTEIVGAHLTERTMRLSVAAPEITALAPVLLRNYRSPYGGADERSTDQGSISTEGGQNLPIVFGGFEVSNSETGGGAFTITPRLVVRICNNGMTIKRDAMRAVHLGGQLEEGSIDWSHDTQTKILDVVKAKARDAVTTFLDRDYVARVVEGIEQTSSTPIEDAAGTIERVAKVHQFSDAEQASILDCFIKSGDVTAGGVMQAVTAAAQRVDDADRQAELESMALDVLATAAK